MIISRSPLRITLGGGGSDLPQYIEKFGSGCSFTASIDKYIRVVVHDSDRNWIMKYSEYEKRDRVEDINHDIIRATLQYMISEGYIEDRPLEISSYADISGRSGLGSSGVFGVALAGALYYHNREDIEITNSDRYEIADIAFRVALSLGRTTGAQDFYASCFGGTICIFYDSLTDVTVERITDTTIPYNLYLYDLKISRDADKVLKEIQYDDFDDYLKIRGKSAAEDFARKNWDELFDNLRRQDRRKHLLVNEHKEIVDTIEQLYEREYIKCIKTIGSGRGGYLLIFSEEKITDDKFMPIRISNGGLEIFRM